jgi:hypothetical protein
VPASGEIDTSVVITNAPPDPHSGSLADLNLWSQADLIQRVDEAAL